MDKIINPTSKGKTISTLKQNQPKINQNLHDPILIISANLNLKKENY